MVVGGHYALLFVVEVLFPVTLIWGDIYHHIAVEICHENRTVEVRMYHHLLSGSVIDYEDSDRLAWTLISSDDDNYPRPYHPIHAYPMNPSWTYPSKDQVQPNPYLDKYPPEAPQYPASMILLS